MELEDENKKSDILKFWIQSNILIFYIIFL